MRTEADIVTPEKLRALVTSDHKRGCQGREYGCSCGYDDDKDAMIELAAVALEQLRAERDAANEHLVEALTVISEQYENGCVNHVDFRVHAKMTADAALEAYMAAAIIATDRETL